MCNYMYILLQIVICELNYRFRLVHDRELQLHDGKRLLRWDRYDALKYQHGYNDDELNLQHGVYRVDPKFYIVATANPPRLDGTGKSKAQWLTPEMLTLFFYHQLPDMEMFEELEVIESFVRFPHSFFTLNYNSSVFLAFLQCTGGLDIGDMERLLKTARSLRKSTEASKKSLASSLSTRQLIRIAQRSEKFRSVNSNGLFEEISRACLSRYLSFADQFK